MKQLLSISGFFILLSLAGPAKAQRSDGFFVQELCYIDIDLLKKLKINRIEITLYEFNKKSKTAQLFLDSNCRKIKDIVTQGGSTETNEYASTSIADFNCPIVTPDYIKECVNGRVTKTVNGQSYRLMAYDSAGRIISDKWKPSSSALEISREFAYSKNDLLDAIHNKDIRKDGSVDKEELFIYHYENDRLSRVEIQVKYSTKFENNGELRYDYYPSGLLKKMHGDIYNGRYSVRTEINYYSADGTF
jgi:hypothetical protein